MVGRTVVTMSLALAATGCGTSFESVTPAEPATAPPAPSSPRGEVLRGRVVYVSDGDTIGVRVGGVVQRIRLLGIDAPETKDPRKPVQCYGPQSSARAHVLMPRDMVMTIVTDPTQDRIDKYGRLLAYVFRTGESKPINEQLVADGAARVYVYRRDRPPLRTADFRHAEAAARAANRGLWRACPGR
jgi:micrococcal nuclease